MPRGVGVRLTDYGVRIVRLEKTGDDIAVVGLDAGPREEVLAPLGPGDEASGEEGAVVFGLGPGDFLTASQTAESSTGQDDIQVRLRWELEQKILSPPDEYNLDFLIVGDRGFGFAARRKRVDEAARSREGALTDVEPVALFNGIETSGELSEACTAVIAIESEGITVVIAEGKLPVFMDSVVYRDQGISTVLAGLNETQIAEIGEEESARLFGYARESIDRVTSFGGNEGLPTPERIILAGAGAYAGAFPAMIEQQYGVTPVRSDPFRSVTGGRDGLSDELTGMSSAFTTVFGLAFRAMEV